MASGLVALHRLAKPIKVSQWPARSRDDRRALWRLIDVVVIQQPAHHLLPGLISPANFLLRIGVIGIIGRVIEDAGAFNLCSSGHPQGCRQSIGTLPVEVIARHGESDLRTAVRKENLVLKALA